MPETEALVDAELVLRFQAGEESAFEDLVRRHMKDAYAFALRLCGDPQEAEELSQEGFVHAFRALGAFRGESAFRSWLYRIVINLHRDRRRRLRREETRLGVVREETERRQAATAEGAGVQADELADVVRDRVALLPDRQREVLVLHVYHGLDYRGVASVLGCSYEDVKMNLSLARKKLKEALKEYL
ncbi:MAG: sigma-70 family RNA polymerase sigma factor [Planctomycetes bacterium]|nr:sigma-70 family RNA polymerase sigma factor [Planctomycetota bacterium]